MDMFFLLASEIRKNRDDIKDVNKHVKDVDKDVQDLKEQTIRNGNSSSRSTNLFKIVTRLLRPAKFKNSSLIYILALCWKRRFT